MFVKHLLPLQAPACSLRNERLRHHIGHPGHNSPWPPVTLSFSEFCSFIWDLFCFVLGIRERRLEAQCSGSGLISSDHPGAQMQVVLTSVPFSAWLQGNLEGHLPARFSFFFQLPVSLLFPFYSMISFCPECGKNIEAAFKFCPYCGKPLPTDERTQSPTCARQLVSSFRGKNWQDRVAWGAGKAWLRGELWNFLPGR